MDTTSESVGIRKALRRWKDRWRVSSYSSSRSSVRSTSSSRPPSNTSSATGAPAPAPAPTSYPSYPSRSLSPVPGSPLPIADALFSPTTQTFIHSPADPRSRTASTTSSPGATLRKSPPLSRRNTTPTEHLQSFVSSHRSPSPGSDVLPLNTVTTTIVAGNDTIHKKRSSRFRLSISKSRPAVSPPLSSPSSTSFFDRSSSRATNRFDPVEEVTPRKRADTKVSDPETLLEEKPEIAETEKPKTEERAGKKTDKTEIPENAESTEKHKTEGLKKPGKQQGAEKSPEKQPNVEVEATSEDAPAVSATNTIRMVHVGA
ncbi:hypothetical protein DM02DRAFT_731062 [Periconia macrospinosa]|uniref:Uncharacterized protein n=1 Tax=Periconia macrospinosa TaxID=97972 RepID=A0A2V1DF50_9PLEO|nr:hypothetical protein DM02DRAFT_731062 [Periconia macrospinosa]